MAIRALLVPVFLATVSAAAVIALVVMVSMNNDNASVEQAEVEQAAIPPGAGNNANGTGANPTMEPAIPESWPETSEAPPKPATSLAPQDPDAVASAPSAAVAASPESGNTGPAEKTGKAPLPNQIRNVSPEGVTTPDISGTLTRIAPSERLQELLNPAAEPLPDGIMEIVAPTVVDGGHLKTGQITIQLAHIEPLTLDQVCQSRIGGEWPCGVRARSFLQGLVRRFKIVCEKADELGPREILATCTRGKINLGKRLVRHGWADPLENAPDDYRELAALAQEKKRGKWQSDWLEELPPPSAYLLPEAGLPDLQDIIGQSVEWSEPVTLNPDSDPPDSVEVIPWSEGVGSEAN